MSQEAEIAAAWEVERELESEWERVVAQSDVPEVSQAWAEEIQLESGWESSVLSSVSAPVVKEISAPVVKEISALVVEEISAPGAKEVITPEPATKPKTSFLPAPSQSREAYVPLPSQELQARERAKITKRKAELRLHLEQQCKLYDEYMSKLALEQAAKRLEIKQRLDQHRTLQRKRALVFEQATKQRIAQFRVEEEHRQRELAEKQVEVRTRIVLLDSARKQKNKPEALKAMF
ncbi:hypothetical protein BASA81_000355 [Batrachochytrium salamandrivorans]|nr:hypothetical protein BASA81_000355 [Batrachochytrium salamandrivorans]